jgi:hypothetical protein
MAIPTARNSHDAIGEANNVSWNQALSGSVVADLSVGVVSPALDAARAEYNTQPHSPNSGDRNDSACQAADGLGSQAARGRIIAQLAEVVVAPALHAAGCEQRTSKGTAGGNSRNIGEANDRHRVIALRVGEVAKLPVIVHTPTSRTAAG